MTYGSLISDQSNIKGLRYRRQSYLSIEDTHTLLLYCDYHHYSISNGVYII
jgi:hypothetical protein